MTILKPNNWTMFQIVTIKMNVTHLSFIKVNNLPTDYTDIVYFFMFDKITLKEFMYSIFISCNSSIFMLRKKYLSFLNSQSF